MKTIKIPKVEYIAEWQQLRRFYLSPGNL